jgi:UDP-2-acetamido-2,6-beta-L-arabino-hexul-4-ose reductase
MRILVTGSRGFIGKNLAFRLAEIPGFELSRFERGDSLESLFELVGETDAVIHLAGENRPKDASAFARVNAELTKTLCSVVRASGRNIPFVLASSMRAGDTSPYGTSKHEAEQAVEGLASDGGNPCIIYRLPNVFGKWCKPNYNSVVATFCHNIARDMPIHVESAATRLRLVYVDDVVSEFIRALHAKAAGARRAEIAPEYSITLGELAAQIEAFKNCRSTLLSERVGCGLVRALYATYVSYLPPDKFSYGLRPHSDQRGAFVEMLKTPDCGQFSFFTARPGVTRGGHYHHSKSEKFLVTKGVARFGFRNVLTNETHEIITSGDAPAVVETVPGWTHDITNIGDGDMIVMLWANEIYDPTQPDTIACKV